jgi:hypothetical protein
VAAYAGEISAEKAATRCSRLCIGNQTEVSGYNVVAHVLALEVFKSTGPNLDPIVLGQPEKVTAGGHDASVITEDVVVCPTGPTAGMAVKTG